MLWRLKSSTFKRQQGAGNKKAMETIVDHGGVPGILAYSGKEPVGWCAVAPREEYSALERSRILKPIDNLPIWSVSCMFVNKEYRKKGMSVKLLRAAIDHVRQRGGTILEGYPVEPSKNEIPAVFAWTGWHPRTGKQASGNVHAAQQRGRSCGSGSKDNPVHHIGFERW